MTRIALVFYLVLATALCAYGQKHNSDTPRLVHFVAPAYPRAAKDQRIMGKTVTRITVAADGAVTTATIVSAHPVFEKYVLDALKQWKFEPSPQEHVLEITCSFEFYDEDCEKPLTPETQVVADLPHMVRIRTGLQCVQVFNP